MKPLKYQELMKAHGVTENCPYAECQECTIDCYRWTKEDIEHEDNFLPLILLDEKYSRPPRVLQGKNVCNQFALSLFDTLEAAKNRFASITQRHRAKLGWTHVASGKIINEMGVTSNIEEQSRHFSYFEYENVTLADKFQVISELS